MSSNWQPILTGALIRLRPLEESDLDELYLAASDPLVWEQHPEKDRFKREVFEVYFRAGIASKGALAVIDQKTGIVIGSSRFNEPKTDSVEIGYTFIGRAYWGRGYNSELKLLMVNHAFQFVPAVHFYVGDCNLRSQAAVRKIGGVEIDRVTRLQLDGKTNTSVQFELKKADWRPGSVGAAIRYEQPPLATSRLLLEPVSEAHAEELASLFSDPELHRFVPFEPISVEKQRERCARWAGRRSPDGREIWLNWLGRDRATGKGIGHFQAGMTPDGVASIGYLIARDAQGNGLATEGAASVLAFLKQALHCREARAWSDTRNEASHRLARRLGMRLLETIKDADYFKGSSSDEYVFSKIL